MKLDIKLFLGFILITYLGLSQSTSDCIGALPFCTSTGEGEPTVSPGDGNVSNETQLACVDNEGYSTWYTFTPTSDGFFRFTLNPVNGDDDYDWALFNVTNSSCSSIPNDPSLLVSCNSWGDTGSNGPTGISTSMGGSGNQNGPGTTNGPPFNADLQVFAGETYKLMVSNWSQSTSGFNINVSESTANGISANSGISNFDDQTICDGDSIIIDVDFTGTQFGTILYSWFPEELFVDPFVQDPVFVGGLNSSVDITLELNNGPCTYIETNTIILGILEYEIDEFTQNLCIGEKLKLGINFTGNILPGGLKYKWSPDSILTNPNSANPITDILTEDTKYYFEVQNGPCKAFDSLTVKIHNDTVDANFDFTISDDLETIPIEVDFTNLSIGDSVWKWFFGDSTTSTERHPFQYEYDGYDTYEVILVAQSSSIYCIDTARKTIVFPKVVIPNIITPNDDGFNDVLVIRGMKVNTGINIFNRWGKLVYETDLYKHDWKGEGLADGLYFIEYINSDKENTKGWIQIVR